MVTERKGCGLVHAVNGGFSWACGHCARANEVMELGPTMASPATGDGKALKFSFSGEPTSLQNYYEQVYLSGACYLQPEGEMDAATVGDVGNHPWMYSEPGGTV